MIDPLFLALIANIFLLGILTVLAVWYGRAHLSTKRQQKQSDAPQKMVLPPAVKQELLSAAEHEYQAILDHSATDLQKDLQKTTEQLSRQLSQFGGSVIKDEVGHYKEVVEKLRLEAEQTLVNSQSEVTALHESMKQKVAADVEQEKQRLMSAIDTKLHDAVTSYLIENLQYNIDLGAQSDYILKSLDEHKDELKEAIGGRKD